MLGRLATPDAPPLAAPELEAGAADAPLELPDELTASFFADSSPDVFPS